MPKLFSDNTPSPTPVAQPTAVSFAPREQAHGSMLGVTLGDIAGRPPHPAPSGRPREGVAMPPKEIMDKGGGDFGPMPNASEFAPLTQGTYRFTGWVESIINWSWTTKMALRVLLGPDRGREIDWEQTMSEKMPEKGRPYWTKRIIEAYSAGGWTWDPDPARGWPGWFDTGTIAPDGKPVRSAPYDTFFVWRAPDGVVVPLLLDFTVQVDAPPYDKFVKVIRVSLHLIDGGRPVQAWMPRKVPDWLAAQHGWRGTTETISKNGEVLATVVKLDGKQIQPGHGGLATMKDLKR